MRLPHGWSTARVHDYGVSGVYLHHLLCGWISTQAISEYDTRAARRIINSHACRGRVTEVVEVVETTEYVDYGYTSDVGFIEPVVEEVVEYIIEDNSYDTGGYDGGGFSSDW